MRRPPTTHPLTRTRMSTWCGRKAVQARRCVSLAARRRHWTTKRPSPAPAPECRDVTQVKYAAPPSSPCDVITLVTVTFGREVTRSARPAAPYSVRAVPSNDRGRTLGTAFSLYRQEFYIVDVIYVEDTLERFPICPILKRTNVASIRTCSVSLVGLYK